MKSYTVTAILFKFVGAMFTAILLMGAIDFSDCKNYLVGCGTVITGDLTNTGTEDLILKTFNIVGAPPKILAKETLLLDIKLKGNVTLEYVSLSGQKYQIEFKDFNGSNFMKGVEIWYNGTKQKVLPPPTYSFFRGEKALKATFTEGTI